MYALVSSIHLKNSEDTSFAIISAPSMSAFIFCREWITASDGLIVVLPYGPKPVTRIRTALDVFDDMIDKLIFCVDGKFWFDSATILLLLVILDYKL